MIHIIIHLSTKNLELVAKKNSEKRLLKSNLKLFYNLI
jgi:hypothetical protein